MHLEKALLHRRLPPRHGTLEEAIRVTGILKSEAGAGRRAGALPASSRHGAWPTERPLFAHIPTSILSKG